MSKVIFKLLQLLLIAVIMFSLPVLAIGQVNLNQTYGYDGYSDDNYENLEAPPLYIDKYPFPINEFNIELKNDNTVILTLKTSEEVSLILRYGASNQKYDIQTIESKPNIQFDEILSPLSFTNSFIDIYLYNDKLKFSTTIQIIDGEVINNLGIDSEYILQNVGDASILGTTYEIEPNNTSGTATSTINGNDNLGNFSTTTDTVDWYKFSLSYRAFVNFFLGNIPVGSDYDILLYSSSNLTTPIWSGTNSGNSNELLINKDLQSGTYYLKVYRYSGPNTTSYYNMRWRINKHWPVLWTTTVNSGFRTPDRPTHDGIDINYTFLTPTPETNLCNDGKQCYSANNIAATWDGTVSYVDNPPNPSTGAGRAIYVNHNVDGVYYQTRYFHLHSIGVTTGATVKSGQVIGVMGNTGGVLGTTGTHLHYEIRSCTTSSCTTTTPIDPMTHYPGY